MLIPILPWKQAEGVPLQQVKIDNQFEYFNEFVCLSACFTVISIKPTHTYAADKIYEDDGSKTLELWSDVRPRMGNPQERSERTLCMHNV